MTMRFLAVVAAAAMVTACSGGSGSGSSAAGSNGATGSSSGSSGGTSGTSGAVGTFCASINSAFDTLISQCLVAPADIVASSAKVLDCAQVEEAVQKGRTTFDSSHAQPCLSALQAYTCAQVDNPSMSTNADCQQVLIGTVAAGSACVLGSDCSGTTSWCTSTPGNCTGVCKAQIAAGAACGVGDECVSNYSCANSLCTQTNAVTKPGLGAACTGFESCANGLACDLISHTCVAPVLEGQSCAQGHQVCELYTSCSTNSTCTRWGGAGATCGSSAAGEIIACLPGSYCTIAMGMSQGTCVVVNATGSCTQGNSCASGDCINSMCAAACVEP